MNFLYEPELEQVAAANVDNPFANLTKAPGGTSVTNKTPSSEKMSPGDIENLVSQVQLVDSLQACMVGVLLQTRRPQGYDLSNPDDAAQCVIDQANAYNDIMIGDAPEIPQSTLIPSWMSPTSATEENKSFDTKQATFHLDFLKSMFTGLLDPTHLTSMDDVLTAVADNLRELKLSTSTKNESLHHYIKYNYITHYEGAEDVPIMTSKLLFVQIDSKCWRIALGKHHAEEFHFDSIVYSSTGELNSQLVGANEDKIIEDISNIAQKAKVPKEKIAPLYSF